MKRLFTIIFLLAFIFTSIVYFALSRNDTSTPAKFEPSNRESLDTSYSHSCLNKISSLVEGNWQTKPSHGISTSIILNPNNTFTLENLSEQLPEKITGSWSLDTSAASLNLKFDKALDQKIIDTVLNPYKDKYTSWIYEFDLESNTLEFLFGYSDDLDSQDNNCTPQRYFLNIFTQRLNKQD
jgi:hypothetical protein